MNERGFSLVGVLVALAVTPLLLMVPAVFFDMNQKDIEQANLTVTGAVLRSSLVAILENETAWQATLNDKVNAASCNPSLACLQKGTDCATNPASGKGAKLSPNNPTAPIGCLYDADGTVLFNANDPKAGFDLTGKACDAFDAVNGNPACPLRPTISWEMVCAVGPCVAPPIIVHVSFVYKSDHVFPINLDKFSVLARRDPQ